MSSLRRCCQRHRHLISLLSRPTLPGPHPARAEIANVAVVRRFKSSRPSHSSASSAASRVPFYRLQREPSAQYLLSKHQQDNGDPLLPSDAAQQHVNDGHTSAIAANARISSYTSNSSRAHIAAAANEPLFPEENKRIAVHGVVQRIVSRSEATGFTLARIKLTGGQEILLLARCPRFYAGEVLNVDGIWQYDRKHGWEVKALGTPYTEELDLGIQDSQLFLEQPIIKGIGAKLARQLCELFPNNIGQAFEEPDHNANPVSKRLGKKRWQSLCHTWQRIKLIRSVERALLLQGKMDQLSVQRCASELVDHFGADALAMLEDNPYWIARLRLPMTFSELDRFAMSRTPAAIQSSPEFQLNRLAGSVHFALAQAENSGQCGVSTAELKAAVKTILNEPVVAKDLKQLGPEHGVIHDLDALGKSTYYDRRLYEAEQAVGRRLRQMATAQPWWLSHAEQHTAKVKPSEKLNNIESSSLGQKITLSPSQNKALEMILASNVAVVTGGPGVGKTALVRAVADAVSSFKKRRGKVKVVLCAPTGRAAQRLSESTGYEAQTIHTLLGAKEESGREWTHGSENPISADAVIVDEASMVDVHLMHRLVSALPNHTSLLLVGDADQLPPVGPGDVLRDVIDSGAVPVAKLTEVHRQAAHSDIIRVSSIINKGDMPDCSTSLGESDLVFVECEPKAIPERILSLIQDELPSMFPGLDMKQDVQVVAPMKSRGTSSTSALNKRLQQLFSPKAGVRRSHVSSFTGQMFRRGDKVMQLTNDPDKGVFNGEIGEVTLLNLKQTADEVMEVTFSGDRVCRYNQGELDRDVALAYAITVHKAQGCEFPIVVVPLTMEHQNMLRRKLLYTAVTRGRQQVVLVGQRAALLCAVSNSGVDEAEEAAMRRSKLRAWLEAEESSKA